METRHEREMPVLKAGPPDIMMTCNLICRFNCPSISLGIETGEFCSALKAQPREPINDIYWYHLFKMLFNQFQNVNLTSIDNDADFWWISASLDHVM